MAIAVWLTGLPGSGKSTIAHALKRLRPDSIILSMDELRGIVTPSPLYTDAERDMVYRCIVYVAHILTQSGHNVIIDATGNLRIWRDLARSIISSFVEVYLACDIHVCTSREQERKDRHWAPADIYKKAIDGWPVPGVNVPYEPPLCPDLTLDTQRLTVDEITAAIDSLCQDRKVFKGGTK